MTPIENRDKTGRGPVTLVRFGGGGVPWETHLLAEMVILLLVILHALQSQAGKVLKDDVIVVAVAAGAERERERLRTGKTWAVGNLEAGCHVFVGEGTPQPTAA